MFSLVRRYGSSHIGMLSLFVFLAVFGTLTESFGVFLLVPLLQTMGQSNIFSNVPLLGRISAVFEVLPADTRLLWAGGLMLIIVLLRGALQFAQEFVGYAIPHRIDFYLRLRAYSAFVNTSMQFVDTIGAGEISNITVGHSARIGILNRGRRRQYLHRLRDVVGTADPRPCAEGAAEGDSVCRQRRHQLRRSECA